MKRKLLIATLLTVAMVALTAFSGDTRDYILSNIPDIEPAESIIVGVTTRFDENMLGGWTNPAPNAHVRGLMFYNYMDTMARNIYNEFFPNPIVMVDGLLPTITDNANGSRTYTFTIYTTNRFSDGTYITAKHYAGHIALRSSYQWIQVGSNATSAGDVYGWAAWQEGEAETLKGVRIYSDSEFSVTIAAEFLPFIWEKQNFMNWSPFPLHAIGVEAHDDGYGVFITALNKNPLTGLDLAINGYIYGTGFRFAPTVVPGPYMFHSFDPDYGVLILGANPYFSGTWDGYRPRIRYVIFRYIGNTILVDAVGLGMVDMIVDQGSGLLINDLLTLVDRGTHSYTAYLRNGMGLIQFHADHGPTQFTAVRQALQFLTDREFIAEFFTHGHGMVTHGPYSPVWWWTAEAIERGMYDEMIMYTLDISRAIELLEANGWVYTSEGEPFVGPGDGINHIRHKWVDGELMPLDIHWATFPVEFNFMTQAIKLVLPYTMEYAGFRLTIYTSTNALAHLTRSINFEPEFHMFNLGMNFATLWQPWYTLSPYTSPAWNWGNVNNPEVYELATRLRFIEILTEEGQDEFVDAFIDLMVRLNYESYIIPLFVNYFYDFTPIWLNNWHNASTWGLPMAIVRAYIEENI